MSRGEGASMRRSELLLTVADELRRLGAAASAIQGTLGDILRDAAGDGPAGFWQMQEIDRLQQTLDDLSAVLRAVADDDGLRLDVEQIAAVARLGALRERLRGSAGDASGANNAGIVAIF